MKAQTHKWTHFRGTSGMIYERGPSSCIATVFANAYPSQKSSFEWAVNSWGNWFAREGTAKSLAGAKKSAVAAQGTCMRKMKAGKKA